MKEPKRHIKRSREMLIASYYLARYGVRTPGDTSSPPSALGVEGWEDAYRLFYDALGDGRSLSQFRNSLLGVRVIFDHLFPNGREGFGSEEALSEDAKDIHEKWKGKSRSELETYVLGLLRGADRLDDVPCPVARTEGGEKVFTSIRRERDLNLRKRALAIHGYDCMACAFNFEERYGPLGKEFLEVHHAVPLAEAGERWTNPETDLVVLCSNCHRMVHHQKGVCLSLDELKKHIKRRGRQTDRAA